MEIIRGLRSLPIILHRHSRYECTTLFGISGSPGLSVWQHSTGLWAIEAYCAKLVRQKPLCAIQTSANTKNIFRHCWSQVVCSWFCHKLSVLSVERLCADLMQMLNLSRVSNVMQTSEPHPYYEYRMRAPRFKSQSPPLAPHKSQEGKKVRSQVKCQQSGAGARSSLLCPPQ